MSITFSIEETPALLIRISMAPNFSMVFTIRSPTSLLDLTSTLTANDLLPSSFTSFAVCSASSKLISAVTTFAPSFAKASAITFPIPLPAPVTIATLLSNSISPHLRFQAKISQVCNLIIPQTVGLTIDKPSLFAC